ncbi:MAG: 3-methyl-2-oxobutanoate hydroxymethyltransferase, partial [Acidobacteria bacterium]|nr:3-methyl-2-oxobutanoate hydroxymethyltransferase [Acidobacteriota bacterium]
IGQFQAFTPKFVKKYADIATVITGAMASYVKDVKGGAFPEDQHCYHILPEEEEKIQALFKEYK